MPDSNLIGGPHELLFALNSCRVGQWCSARQRLASEPVTDYNVQTIIGITGDDDPLLRGGEVMPLNEIPNHFDPETRSSIEAALEDAWQELSKDGNLEATLARKKLRTITPAAAEQSQEVRAR